MSNTVISNINKLFTANKMTLNLHKTNVTKFIINNSQQYTLNICYDEKHTEDSVNT
jgi:hypothetical protein